MNDFIIRLPRQKSSFNCKRLRELLDDTSAGSNDVEVDEVKIDFQKRHRTAEVTVDVTKPTSSISRLYGKKSICSSGSGAGVGNGRGAVQMYLDLGQRSFGRASNCPDCGMLFVQDDLEDRRRHAAHCREVCASYGHVTRCDFHR